MEGEAEADQLTMFLNGLPEDLDDEVKFEFWKTLRKLDSIRSVAGTFSFYLINLFL